MSKDLYLACHEALIEEYMEEMGCDYNEAYEATADAAYVRMQDNLADYADMRRKQKMEDGI